MLWAAGHDDDLADLPLAVRDKALLSVLHKTFGPKLALVTDCQECGTELELDLAAAELTAELRTPGPETFETGHGTFKLRSLTSRDLADAAALPEAEIAAFLRNQLTDGNLPPALIDQIDAQIQVREAQGEITFSLTCAACGAVWSEPFDIAAHVWSEIEAAARRIMDEVAELASAFCWTEPQILALSPVRRAAYLSRARAR